MGSGPGLSCDITMNTRLNAEERKLYQNPDTIRRLLHSSRTIAIVGLSDKSERPSNFVGSYLKSEGYRIVPVNPQVESILGEKSYPDLRSIPFPVDIVDVFRRPDVMVPLMEDAIAIKARAFWMQLGLVNREAAEAGRKAGLEVIMDRCIKMEHGRYSGALHWAGMNTEIITARKTGRFI